MNKQILTLLAGLTLTASAMAFDVNHSMAIVSDNKPVLELAVKYSDMDMSDLVLLSEKGEKMFKTLNTMKLGGKGNYRVTFTGTVDGKADAPIIYDKLTYKEALRVMRQNEKYGTDLIYTAEQKAVKGKTKPWGKDSK